MFLPYKIHKISTLAKKKLNKVNRIKKDSDWDALPSDWQPQLTQWDSLPTDWQPFLPSDWDVMLVKDWHPSPPTDWDGYAFNTIHPIN